MVGEREGEETSLLIASLGDILVVGQEIEGKELVLVWSWVILSMGNVLKKVSKVFLKTLFVAGVPKRGPKVALWLSRTN